MCNCALVVPHAGTWIEIKIFPPFPLACPRSFPTRERGLKSDISNHFMKYVRSFPTRERGLKLELLINGRCPLWSFPTRERGLKLPVKQACNPASWSFPTRERGLKSVFPTVTTTAKVVVPHAGTWIEMAIYAEMLGFVRSFPTRERGLKLHICYSVSVNSRRSPRGNVD